MENASKALIIAGAILLSILIIAIGMYVYNGAQSTINESMSSMSESEKNAFNSKFVGYENAATGSQVKNLIGDLITNASNYAEEPAKIVSLRFNQITAGNNDGNLLNCPKPANANKQQGYTEQLGRIRNKIEAKHTYWVELVYDGNSGLIHTINIFYNKGDTTGSGSGISGTQLKGQDLTANGVENSAE